MHKSNLPVGSVIASMFPWPRFRDMLGKSAEDWIPADGSLIAQDTAYHKLMKNTVEQVRAPDLRGRFQRGLNDFDSPGGTIAPSTGNPETYDASNHLFEAGSYQADALKRHTHPIATRHGNIGKSHVATGVDQEAPDLETLENDGADETRPRNVSLYYYLKVN